MTKTGYDEKTYEICENYALKNAESLKDPMAKKAKKIKERAALQDKMKKRK